MDPRHSQHKWTKSSRCGNGGCIEVAHSDNGSLVRDSTDPNSPILAFGSAQWTDFLAGVRAGKLRAI
jgi:hypothetical protein